MHRAGILGRHGDGNLVGVEPEPLECGGEHLLGRVVDLADVGEHRHLDPAGKPLEAAGGVGVREVPAFRPYTTLEVRGVGAVLEHLRAVVALEEDGVAGGEAVEYGGGDGAGVGAAPDAEVALGDTEPAGVAGIVGGGEGFDREVADGERLAAPASPDICRRRPVFLRERLKRAAGRVNRNVKLPREDVDPPDVIDVFVGDEDRLDERCVGAGVCDAAEGLACGEPRVDEQRTMLPPDIGAVSLASARKDGQFHYTIGGLRGYLSTRRGGCTKSLVVRDTIS